MPVKWEGDQIRAKIAAAAFKGVVAGAEMVAAEGTRLIQTGPKTGRVYRRRGVTHRASAPGEAPASDSGQLAGSSVIRHNVQQLTAVASWAKRYARPLELGSAYTLGVPGSGAGQPDAAQLELGTQKLEPRPFARPALANTRQAIQDRVAAEIGAVLK